ncbi:DnaJ C-terminal domain-containing protein [Eisenibacter elegans]|jgi:curved DNA-binding protein|uniref:DnaJ C-terminal domain-containing protein n=1 Tax=Eisenibacter elegans TaxID=997 RepID=UPI0003F7E4F7|nr:DnaJ C-terminal domain-containing protein [Eisenibacter elegans]
MPAITDYYQLLGLSRNATQTQIKEAYRELAVKLHPDRNPGNPHAEEHFKQITEAYNVLSNPKKRAQYDQLRLTRRMQEMVATGNVDLAETLKDIFGENILTNFVDDLVNYRGEDIRQTLHISLAEALEGSQQRIEVLGKPLRIQLKPGIAHGQVLKIKGQGGEGSKPEKRGDLLLTIHISPQPGFTRQGNDLYTHYTIDLYTALLGGQVQVPSWKEGFEHPLSIPAGIQPNTTLTLQGHGAPLYEQPGEYGNLHINVQVALPTQLSPEAQTLVQKLAQKAPVQFKSLPSEDTAKASEE